MKLADWQAAVLAAAAVASVPQTWLILPKKSGKTATLAGMAL